MEIMTQIVFRRFLDRHRAGNVDSSGLQKKKKVSTGFIVLTEANYGWILCRLAVLHLFWILRNDSGRQIGEFEIRPKRESSMLFALSKATWFGVRNELWRDKRKKTHFFDVRHDSERSARKNKCLRRWKNRKVNLLETVKCGLGIVVSLKPMVVCDWAMRNIASNANEQL